MLKNDPTSTIALMRTSRRMAYVNPESISHRGLGSPFGEGVAWESRQGSSGLEHKGCGPLQTDQGLSGTVFRPSSLVQIG
jgi:hypothetical protein